METAQPMDSPLARAARLGYPVVDLETTEISLAAVQLISEAVARQERILPLAIDDDTLKVAMSREPNPETLDRLRFLLRRTISVVLTTEEALLASIERCYRGASLSPRDTPNPVEPIDFVEVPDVGAETHEAIPDPDGTPVARLVQSIIAEALRLGASRMLIQPIRQRVKVAYRVEDAVYSRQDLPTEMLYPVLVRLMTMANLSGFIKLLAGGRERKLRVVFKPTRYGLSALMEVTQDVSVLELSRAKAAKLGYAFVTLDQHRIPKETLAAVPESVARDYGVLPWSLEENVLTLVTGVPPTPETVERLQFVLNRRISLAMASEGAILAAIDRYYGPADPETADVLLWELAQSPEPSPAAAPVGRVFKLLASPPSAARPLLDHLRTVYHAPMLEYFENLGSRGTLCRQDPATGDLTVVFPQSNLVEQMPAAARKYLESKVWGLREAIVSRLECFLERNALARRMAMTYSQYLACCQLADGRRVPINPASAPDAWLNFLYALILRAFPSIDSNGALLQFVTEQLPRLSEVIESLLNDPAMVVEPGAVRRWLARLESQTSTGEAIDFDSSPVIQLVELLLAEAVHHRAARIAIVPLEDRVEVSYRIQRAAYVRESLPLERLYPVLARLRMFTELSGELALTVGEKDRRLQVSFHATPCGLAALIKILPDVAAVEACRTQAAKLGWDFVRLEEVNIPAPLLAPLPKAVAWKKTVLPLALHEVALTVALSRPPTPRQLDELRLIFNRQIAVALAPEDDILAAIYRHYHPMPAGAAVSPTALALLGLAEEHAISESQA
jgi:type II secretory ATPase GspE/PulE/Tfp pilus assembly ATPase PilB-like protein